MDPTTKQDGKAEKDFTADGRFAFGNKANKTGRGGFADHPENRNPGGRPKNLESFKYWLDYFKKMSVDEFLCWQKEISNKDRTVAAELAFLMIVSARNNLKSFKEIADITEGKPRFATENAENKISKVRVEIIENRKQ
ncbi:MAG TPA: hypothetical protein VG895_04750 [Patescibacteria group bacterium]|nr:hypothetical protein [Patescibacteria group bacterium]